MKRDFSEKSRRELLGLVSEVESENSSVFTDWLGDRWYDFETWIGKLNIKNYLNDINTYHKKVIDKNNATHSSINKIFNNVKSVDTSYKNFFFNSKRQLQQWRRYINELSNIVNPQNGRFDAGYMSESLNKIISDMPKDSVENLKNYFSNIWNSGKGVKELFELLVGESVANIGITRSYTLSALINKLSDEYKNDTFTGDDLKTGLSFLSEINKVIGKYGENSGVALSSSLLSYLSTLCGITNLTNSSGLNITSYMLELFESSIDVENGIFDYYSKKLTPYEVSKLDGKFGKTMTGLSILSSIAGTANSGIDTYKVYIDPNSTSYDKAAQSIKMGGSVFDLGLNAYIAKQASGKALRFVSSSGSAKAVNQILQTAPELSYTTSSAATSKITKAGTVLAVGDVTVSTVSTAVKCYGDVTADGYFDWGDAGTVGVHSSLSGLNSVTSNLTLGLVNFDSEKVANDLENKVDDFVSSDSWAAQYIRNQDNNVVLRFGVSIGSGAYILYKKMDNDVENCKKTIGSWISNGWNTVTNWF